MMPGPDDMMGMSQAMSFKGDGYSMSYDMWQGVDGSQKLVTESKFDDYFMYSMDTTGPMRDGYDMPVCGPMAPENKCDKMINEDSCCTHVEMKDPDNGMQHSFYRCMNQ
jgi:hypothetical protein